jgi:hypothetical protein
MKILGLFAVLLLLTGCAQDLTERAMANADSSICAKSKKPDACYLEYAKYRGGRYTCLEIGGFASEEECYEVACGEINRRCCWPGKDDLVSCVADLRCNPDDICIDCGFPAMRTCANSTCYEGVAVDDRCVKQVNAS